MHQPDLFAFYFQLEQHLKGLFFLQIDNLPRPLAHKNRDDIDKLQAMSMLIEVLVQNYLRKIIFWYQLGSKIASPFLKYPPHALFHQNIYAPIL